MNLKLYKKLTEKDSRHGRCSDWIRENRRRRSAGVPQKRVLPFGLGIFDPLDRTITKTLSDGTVEIFTASLDGKPIAVREARR